MGTSWYQILLKEFIAREKAAGRDPGIKVITPQMSTEIQGWSADQIIMDELDYLRKME